MAQFLAGLYVEDLRRPVAASRNVLPIVAEAHAADDALVMERVNQINVQQARDLLVEDTDPIVASLLVVGRDLVDVELTQNAPWLGMVVHAAAVRCGVADLW